MKTRFGVFGGTFDPVHEGHRFMAEAALEHVDWVLVVPCRISPHKLPDGGRSLPTEGEHRWKMLELAFTGVPRVELTRMELERESVSFTWETLERLGELLPEARPVLILGDDQYRALPTWTRFSEWAESVDYLVFQRPGQTGESLGVLPEGLKIEFPKITPPSVSSTEIRERLRRGGSVEGLVAPQVMEYIQAHGLYR